MNMAPKSMRLQIALMGRANSGKSSFLNLISGQDVAITSSEIGTTTDVVEKNQELLPLGPVTWLDTAGLGDTSNLAKLRQEKTNKIFDRADVILLILASPLLSDEDKTIINEAQKRKIPIIKIYNKSDTYNAPQGEICANSLDKSTRDEILKQLTAELIKVCPEEFVKTPPILGDLVPPKSVIVMIVPIDYEAPKGRLILPQVQSIRDALDYNNTIIITKEDTYLDVINNLKESPALVVCDSQVVKKMVEETPQSIPCTTFSTLFARLKGDINILAEGAARIDNLQDDDKVLIAEACTHHAMEDDIGKVKIPRLLRAKTNKNLQIDFVAGHDFPPNLNEYKLVIQCGGCMFGRREILARINRAQVANVPITNYGICISELNGVLERILAPFPQALETYKRAKK